MVPAYLAVRVGAVALLRRAVGGGDDVGPEEVPCLRHELRGHGQPSDGEGFEGEAVGIAVVVGFAAGLAKDLFFGEEGVDRAV